MIQFTWFCPKCGTENKTTEGNDPCTKCGYVQNLDQKTKMFMQIFQKISEMPKENTEND